MPKWDDLKPLPETVIIVAVLGILAIIVVTWGSWPSIVDGLRSLWRAYIARRENIAPLVPLISGLLTAVVALVAAWIALSQMKIARLRHEAQTKADTERRITESFTKAVEQLGHEKLQVRLGGIYALEHISHEEKPDYYWTVMEVLTGFVRERAPWKGQDDASSLTVARLYDGGSQASRFKPSTDIAAILTVIMRRSDVNRAREQSEGWYLDLRSTDLRGADLSQANLKGARLTGAHLEGAHLPGAHLEGAFLPGADLAGAFLTGAHLAGAFLTGADLAGAFLTGAHLQGADLLGADLEGAHLFGAHLQKADLTRADLQKAGLPRAHLEGAFLTEASLQGADLSKAEGLDPSQLVRAFGDAKTKLPEGMEWPSHWPKPEDRT